MQCEPDKMLTALALPTLMSRATLGRAAVQTCMASLIGCSANYNRLGREDLVQALVLPLLQVDALLTISLSLACICLSLPQFVSPCLSISSTHPHKQSHSHTHNPPLIL